jgi:hypothetical protein
MVVGQRYGCKLMRTAYRSMSSSEWANSGTKPKITMRTAPRTVGRVLRMKQAKNAFHRKSNCPERSKNDD